jgi:gluconolactonase
MDHKNGIAVAHVHFGSVWLFDEWGEPTLRVRTESFGRRPTNVCFGGPENETIYITETATGRILSADVGLAGAKLFSHQ